jgi:hypothetical protein
VDHEKRDPIEDLVEKVAHSRDFTDEEVELLKRVADVWRGLESFGRLAVVIRKILMFVGWMAAAWVVFKLGFAEAVKGVKP